VEGGHEEEHGHGPDEEHKDRLPHLVGTASHVDRAPRVHVRS
jgi:hypothetical protein